MAWHETENVPIQGTLNVNHFVTDDNGQLFLKIIPFDNPECFRGIQVEYQATGFFDHGGSFRRRTPEEQVSLVTQAAGYGLRVLPFAEFHEGITYYPYIPDAQTLNEHLGLYPETASQVLEQLCFDLKQAHNNGIVYGDRWSPNILVSGEYGGIIHVDFDIEISGAYAREFEVAQVLYYSLVSGRQASLEAVGAMVEKLDWFDVEVVCTFLKAHAAYFDNTQYGGGSKSDRSTPRCFPPAR